MFPDIRRMAAALMCLVCFPLSEAAAQQAPAAKPVPQTPENTLEYNHLALNSSQTAPYVLAVGHGEYFQVLFKNTDPRRFDYTISAISDDSPKTAKSGGPNTPVASVPNGTTAVTMRHDRHILKYTVSITEKTGGATRDREATAESTRRRQADHNVQNVLYPVSFDLWVRTSEWQIDFNGGFAFSNVTSEKFFIKTDTKGTAATSDDVKTVERDTDGRDAFRPDIIALANVNHTDKYHGLGIAFGVGIGENSDPRYFLGPSWVFGRNLILTAGWTGGKVNVLPSGQEEHQPPIASDNTLNTLGSRFRHGFFVGIGFTVVNRKDEFLGALTASTKSSKPADAADTSGGTAAEKPNEHEEGIQADQLVGTYETADGTGKLVVAKKDATEANSATLLTIAVNGKAPADLIWANSGTQYSVDKITGSKVHFIVSDAGKVTALTYEADADKYDAKRK